MTSENTSSVAESAPRNGATRASKMRAGVSTSRSDSSGRRLAQVSLAFVVITALCIPMADLAVYRGEPWQELGRLAQGFLSPSWYHWPSLMEASLQTVAFALLAVAGSCVAGLGLAACFEWRAVRVLCTSVRAVHELFWALIFMQLFGLSPLTGLLAIAIPYAGIFAKVFAEVFEQQSSSPRQTLAPQVGRWSRLVYTLLPQSWPELASYTRYRFECALRSSAILGFIGLPTLGFFLDTAFKEGHYSEAAALLLVFYLLIASIRLWLRFRLLPIYLLAAVVLLPESPPAAGAYVWQFLTQDIWPRPLLEGDLGATFDWYWEQLAVALPAVGRTLVLSQLALVLTGLLALVCYPLASQLLIGKYKRMPGQTLLLLMRSTPEMVLAFVFLLLFGPSGLPAVIALALHNGGLIGYLLARRTEQLKLRPDAPSGANGYLFEVTPRVYPQFLALLFYRWETILRESAILGILGVATLGFYVDSAFEDIRYDRAAFLILLTALLNIAVDAASRRVRRYCQLGQPRLGRP
jgi:phosphonate transport system permease protein